MTNMRYEDEKGADEIRVYSLDGTGALGCSDDVGEVFDEEDDDGEDNYEKDDDGEENYEDEDNLPLETDAVCHLGQG